MILKGIAVGPYDTNCFVVGSGEGEEGLIIDPGADAATILAAVRDAKLQIKTIVITHGHVDHVGAAQETKKATGAEIAIHNDDVPLSQFYIPFPDRRLKDGDAIIAGKLHFTVIHTPGHSPGGISLYGHGILFCGDTLFNYSIGRTDFMGGNINKLMDSIVTKLMVLPDETVVYPGHGPETTIGNERRHNPFLKRRV